MNKSVKQQIKLINKGHDEKSTAELQIDKKLFAHCPIEIFTHTVADLPTVLNSLENCADYKSVREIIEHEQSKGFQG